MSRFDELKMMLDKANGWVSCVATDNFKFSELSESEAKEIKELVSSIKDEMHYVDDMIEYT